MIIVKNGGKFEILRLINNPSLTLEEEIQDQFLRIEKAGRTCYQSENALVTFDSASKFVGKLIKRGDESVLEHSSLTVKFTNVSRGFTHELVRHRIASFSQESTRYVDYVKRGGDLDLSGFQIYCVVPPHKDEKEKVSLDDGRMMSASEMLAQEEMFYRALRKADWLPEDARQVLPNALRAEIVQTANFREWRHELKLRTSKAAHWEIRSVMCDLLEYLMGVIPVMFMDFTFGGVDSNGLRFYESVK